MTKIAPKGCGRIIEGSDMPCGDHIETGDFNEDTPLVQPVLCDECWDKFKLEEAEEILRTEEGEAFDKEGCKKRIRDLKLKLNKNE